MAQIASTATMVWEESQPESVRLRNITSNEQTKEYTAALKPEDLIFKVSSGR